MGDTEWGWLYVGRIKGDCCVFSVGMYYLHGKITLMNWCETLYISCLFYCSFDLSNIYITQPNYIQNNKPIILYLTGSLPFRHPVLKTKLVTPSILVTLNSSSHSLFPCLTPIISKALSIKGIRQSV